MQCPQEKRNALRPLALKGDKGWAEEHIQAEDRTDRVHAERMRLMGGSDRALYKGKEALAEL